MRKKKQLHREKESKKENEEKSATSTGSCLLHPVFTSNGLLAGKSKSRNNSTVEEKHIFL